METHEFNWLNLPEIGEVKIDLATTLDAGPIGLLSKNLIETSMPGWVWNPAKILKSIQSEDSLVLVGRKQKDVVAAAIIQFGEQDANLNLLAVAKKYQRRGIGSRLLRFMENSAYLYGKAALCLEVRANCEVALEFYAALGYQKRKVLRKYYHNGENAVQMARLIQVQPSEKMRLPGRSN
jgi:ribosomal-protein-alanine N-acetyltransferase